MSGNPKNYGTYADFVREEVRPMQRVGFSVDDLESEASFHAGFAQADDRDPQELDFRY